MCVQYIGGYSVYSGAIGSTLEHHPEYLRVSSQYMGGYREYIESNQYIGGMLCEGAIVSTMTVAQYVIQKPEYSIEYSLIYSI